MLIALGGVIQAAAVTEEELLALHIAQQEALNAHDIDQWLSYWTDDAMWLIGDSPPMRKEETKAFFEGFFQTLPDFHVTPGRVLVSDNIVVEEHSYFGTQLGERSGIPATGNSVEMPHIDIWEFEGDKVKQVTTYQDVVSFMVQIGAMPAPEPQELVPSFTLPDPEPTELTPMELNIALQTRFSDHDLETVAKMIHPDAVIRFSGLGMVPLNREEYIALLEGIILAFPDARTEIVNNVDLGAGWALTELVLTGVHGGPYGTIPATGRPVSLRIAKLIHYDADGLITDFAAYYDELTTLTQLGAFDTQNTLTHHLQALGEGDVDAILSDYAEDAALFTPDGPLHGHDEMRPLFEATVTDILPPGSVFQMLQQIIEGEIAYTVWSAESENYNIPLGTDTFIIRDGKIVTQTFAAQILSKVGNQAPPPTLLELPESAEKDVLMHHLQAIGEGDIDAIMADYAEDAGATR